MLYTGPTTARREALIALAEKQQGYFTSKQAISLGYIKDHHAYHVTRKNWLKILPGLFRLPGYPDSMESEFVKWSLWSRNQQDQPQGVISHPSALAYFGLGEYKPGEVHLTVPLRFQKLVPAEVIIHKASVNLSDLEPRRGFMLTSLPKTLADMRPSLTERNLWAQTVGQALARGLLSSEAYRQLGFAPQVISPGLPETAAAAERPDRPEGSAQMRERIYAMIFQRTQTAGQNPRRRAQAGFTLVELLVVMAVISVLAALLVPALEKARESAYGIVCVNNLRQIGLYFGLYEDDCGEQVALGGFWGASVWFPNCLGMRLAPYTEAPLTDPGKTWGPGSVWVCPKGEAVNRSQYPATWANREPQFTYMINHHTMGATGFAIPLRQLTQSGKAGLKIHFGDGWYDPAGPYWVGATNGWEDNLALQKAHGQDGAPKRNFLYFDKRVAAKTPLRELMPPNYGGTSPLTWSEWNMIWLMKSL